MADVLDSATPRPLLVDGRNPTAGEAISSDDGGAFISIAPIDFNGQVLVTGVAAGVATITVQPDADDIAAGRTAGSLEITVTVSGGGGGTPLVVSLG